MVFWQRVQRAPEWQCNHPFPRILYKTITLHADILRAGYSSCQCLSSAHHHKSGQAILHFSPYRFRWCSRVVSGPCGFQCNYVSPFVLPGGWPLSGGFLPSPSFWLLSTRGSGSNTTVKMTLLAPHPWLTLTTFGHLTLLRPMPIDVISCHNKNIWTSLTRIHSFIGLLIFLPFMVVRVTIAYLRMLGMNWSPTLTCFTIRFHVLMFWHTPLMLIGMRTHRVIAPLRQLDWHCLQNVLIKPLVNAFTPDKKCLGYFSHPIFLFFSYHQKRLPLGCDGRLSLHGINESRVFHEFSMQFCSSSLEDSLPSWCALMISSSIFGPLKGLGP